MSTPTVHRLAEIPAYSGPHAIPGIRFRAVRAALGVQAWGMNLLELDPHCTGHPTHDHAHDGQEEVYLVLEGVALLDLGGETLRLEAGDAVRVPPEASRQLRTTAAPATILALGATPGAPFRPTPGM